MTPRAPSASAPSSLARIALVLAALVALGGCSTRQISALYDRSGLTPGHAAPASSAPRDLAPRDLFVTIDGTSNTLIARTNAARLFEIVDAHSGHRPGGRALATYYAEGVGANGNPLGLAAGLGMGDEIRNAYEFLTLHYRPGDRIFLSGFSRGAYAVRVVGGLVAVAGIPDLADRTAKQRRRIVDDIFDAFKTGRKEDEDRKDQFDRRIERVREVYLKHGVDDYGTAGRGMANATRITAMALWDTVEALGTPDGTADPREEVPYFLLTNCNVDTVLHALALDDNRAETFTPIFADARHMWDTCEGERSGTIEEVWFAGAHSDMGGAYVTQVGIIDQLRGVSLNWMLERLEHHGYALAPAGQRVFADPFGAIHDGRNGNRVYRLFDVKFREPLAYQRLAHSDPDDEAGADAGDPPRPSVHASAITRLAQVKALDRAFPDCSGSRDPRRDYRLLCSADLADVGLVRELREGGCLEEDERGFHLRPDQTCVKVVPDEASRRRPTS